MVSFCNCSVEVAFAKQMIESSSRIYSPYIFAIGQLVGEIPYSIVCGLLYWVLMVRFRRWCWHVLLKAITGLSYGVRAW